MKSAILEAASMVTQNEGRVARTLGALGMAAAIAAGSPSAASSPDSGSKTSVVQPAESGKISFSSDYLAFIKQLENTIKAGWNAEEKKWYPHESPEGGRDTIAYGHKLQSDAEEVRFAKGITEQQALDLLRKDLEDAWQKAASYVKSKHGVALEDLSQKQQEMLTEYAFNLGSLRGFPKFTKAVVEEDWDTARREYKRTYKDTDGKRHELARNKFFYDRYLKPGA